MECKNKGTPITRLLTLHNELLANLCSYLTTPDVRIFGRVNSRLRFFTSDYLTRFRYGTGILSLFPDEVILRIASQLNSQSDCSHFAQASQKFYPLVMRYLARRNVEFGGSSLLIHAATRNLTSMARNLLRLGGNVEVLSAKRYEGTGEFMTPLAIAAYHGHKEITQILLDAGASRPTFDEMGMPLISGPERSLSLAIYEHEAEVAIMLYRALYAGNALFWKVKGITLCLACKYTVIKLVRYLVEEDEPHNGDDTKSRISLRYGSLALYIVREREQSKHPQRNVEDNVYQILRMLLEYGASPDSYSKKPSVMRRNTRGLGMSHRDPRVRLLFREAKPRTTLHTSASKHQFSTDFWSERDETLFIEGLFGEQID